MSVKFGSKCISSRVISLVEGPAMPGTEDNADGFLIVSEYQVIQHNETKYKIIKVIGRGNSAYAFQAESRLISQSILERKVVVLKIFRSNPLSTTMANDEYRFINNAIHGHSAEETVSFPKIYDFFTYKGHPVIVMEQYGPSLYDHFMNIFKMEEIKSQDNPNLHGMEILHVQYLMRQLVKALSLLHPTGCIHADIKPENILFDHLPKRFQNFVLIDFSSSFSTEWKCTYPITTSFYRPPEVSLCLPYNQSLDIWSLGCVAYEAFVGAPLFPQFDDDKLLANFEKSLGPIPKEMIEQSPVRTRYFDGLNLKVQIEDSIHHDYIRMISELYYTRAQSKEQFQRELELRAQLADFVSSCLKYSPADRPTVQDLLKHPFIVDA
ncbi:CMGC family protein kinase [Trichomonas vaginalis G3]|uniref:CMGC family protein kinase n=1 Tax=Trichomonas vaginalis (strain ATCC PRA-98 / G3) TaxID=412133 RepID=A2FW21_TRIV3|nr:protein serine/threonine/tyrosine kinase protein [Trichomonas vaginalis G3]EAX90892.1 CMGC family protein kinase [Trichomonas vaginalis G3]KAI5504022.1 protein serine/threonine/tyrosine kinase protein [Trichomonas vaginalis G3]|eukprot:XP_001303822.1 CMGC family protein kinase [Trichomonas vaginalis G3]